RARGCGFRQAAAGADFAEGRLEQVHLVSAGRSPLMAQLRGIPQCRGELLETRPRHVFWPTKTPFFSIYRGIMELIPASPVAGCMRSNGTPGGGRLITYNSTGRAMCMI